MQGRRVDPLYSIFEQHLFNALVEDETIDELLTRVVTTYIGHLKSSGTLVPTSHLAMLEADLREEAFEMFRKKTYGHFDLASYRKAHGVEAPISQRPAPETLVDQKEKARRGGRAC